MQEGLCGSYPFFNSEAALYYLLCLSVFPSVQRSLTHRIRSSTSALSVQEILHNTECICIWHTCFCSKCSCILKIHFSYLGFAFENVVTDMDIFRIYFRLSNFFCAFLFLVFLPQFCAYVWLYECLSPCRFVFLPLF